MVVLLVVVVVSRLLGLVFVWVLRSCILKRQTDSVASFSVAGLSTFSFLLVTV